MTPLSFHQLPTELQVEVLNILKPYSLRNFSETSQHNREVALLDLLWKRHLDREFPYCLVKGSSCFEKYSIFKRHSLESIKDPIHRKMLVLVEANHLGEISELLSQGDTSDEPLYLTKLCNLVNKQTDENFRQFFFNFYANQDEKLWAITFGQLSYLKNITVTEELFHRAVKYGSLESLEYLDQLEMISKLSNAPLSYSTTAGNLEIIKWLLAHGEEYDDYLLKIATTHGHPEIVRFFIENFKITPEAFQGALQDAILNAQTAALELLLPHITKTTFTIHQLLDFLPFDKENRPPDYRIAECLKLLLAAGADPDYKIDFGGDEVTSLFKLCSYEDNELSIEVLLDYKADPNFELRGHTPLSQCLLLLKKKSIVELLLAKGAKITEMVFLTLTVYNTLEKQDAEILKLLQTNE